MHHSFVVSAMKKKRQDFTNVADVETSAGSLFIGSKRMLLEKMLMEWQPTNWVTRMFHRCYWRWGKLSNIRGHRGWEFQLHKPPCEIHGIYKRWDCDEPMNVVKLYFRFLFRKVQIRGHDIADYFAARAAVSLKKWQIKKTENVPIRTDKPHLNP